MGKKLFYHSRELAVGVWGLEKWGEKNLNEFHWDDKVILAGSGGGVGGMILGERKDEKDASEALFYVVCFKKIASS